MSLYPQFEDDHMYKMGITDNQCLGIGHDAFKAFVLQLPPGNSSVEEVRFGHHQCAPFHKH